jgi:hypothetical protein
MSEFVLGNFSVRVLGCKEQLPEGPIPIKNHLLLEVVVHNGGRAPR